MGKGAEGVLVPQYKYKYKYKYKYIGPGPTQTLAHTCSFVSLHSYTPLPLLLSHFLALSSGCKLCPEQWRTNIQGLGILGAQSGLSSEESDPPGSTYRLLTPRAPTNRGAGMVCCALQCLLWGVGGELALCRPTPPPSVLSSFAHSPSCVHHHGCFHPSPTFQQGALDSG